MFDIFDQICQLSKTIKLMLWSRDSDKFETIVQLMTLWSEQWQRFILLHGNGLADDELFLARCAGVMKPENVRVLNVPSVPLPHHKLLQQKLVQTDIFSPRADGLSLMYGVFLKSDCFPRAYWLAHELVHVAQFERLGGLANGTRQYLHECLNEGYAASALEAEAHRKAVECLKQTAFAALFDNGILNE